MAVHKTIQEAADHLKQAAATVGTRYRSATQRANWASPAASGQAEENYVAGVNEAIGEGRRVNGINRVGDAGWRKGCSDKGADRIGKGITDNIGKYQQNFTPVLTAMNNQADANPPKTRDYAQNVTNRLLPVIEAAKAASPKS